MGVPGFFSWLLKNYNTNNLILEKLQSRPDILYIDSNCLFHPQCFKVLENMSNEKDTTIIENNMMNRIIKYIDYLILYVNPLKLVYVSVDGVAPMAKINQQRKRRFRSIDDLHMKNDIKRKYNIPVNNEWSNIVITPGTEFMEILHKKLIDHFQKNQKVNIIYSSYHTPGEGEHKILQYIKKINNLSNTHVIYGLDADLFFLSMASQMNNIYLLRESSQFSIQKVEGDDTIDESLSYVSIDNVKECYDEQIKTILIRKNDSDLNITNIKHNFCNDFIFLCYLLGNDFLPHLPSVDIKKYGLDILLDCYTDLYLKYKKLIINIRKDDVDIDDDMFFELINMIGKLEKKYFTQIVPEFKEKLKYRKCQTNDKYMKELWEIDNMKNIIINDNIKLGNGGENYWKHRYYEHYFHTNEYQHNFVNEMCYCYLEGLKWVTNYYFKKCIDWRWQYYYSHAPFVSDIANYMAKPNLYKKRFSFKDINFEKTEPLTPCIQLLAVLPPSCNEVLPKSYRSLVTDISPIIDMFPNHVSLDTINKDFYWQCIPMIPIIDVNRLISSTDKLKLSSDEKKRNKELSDYKFNL